MLQLVLGIAGTGKTAYVLDEMAARAKRGAPSILLVPEQFSSTAENMVYTALGDALSVWVEVLSFRTLAERILKMTGGQNLRVLTDAGRAVFVRRALDALEDGARQFGRHRHSASFCAMCAGTIDELKTAGATPALVREIGRATGEAKLTELALVYEAYEAGIANVAVDAQDRLLAAADRADCGYLSQKQVFIDNFDGFTAPEYAMLGKVLALAERVTVALCCDSLLEVDGGLGRFSPVRKTANRLVTLAGKAGIPAQKPVELHKVYRCAAPGLLAVNEWLAFGEMEPPAPADGLWFTQCADEWEETRLAAARIRQLADAGAPYSSMALVCRDVARYEPCVRRAMELYNIPWFLDGPATIEYTAAVGFLRAALRILREGLVSGSILALLKTGLCGYTESEISALENYVYTWSPKAAQWREPFQNNPAGLMAELDDTAKEQLQQAEKLRGETMPELQAFAAACRGQNVAVVCKRLYLLLRHFGAEEHDEAQKQRLAQSSQNLAEEGRRAWDLAMDLLDQMAALTGAEVFTPAEFEEHLLLLVRTTDFGRPPQVLESVIVTSADRMRLADPAHCFVLGLCEGEFPKQVGYSGLLTHADRDLLVEGGVEMPGSFESRVLLEEMFFYRALTSPREELYLSWPVRLGGAAKSPSSAVQPLCDALQPPPLAIPAEALAATPAAAFDLLSAEYRENTPRAATLHRALQTSTHPGAKARLAMLQRADLNTAFSVGNIEALRTLVGRRLTLSATRAERFYQCRFSYYMERVLRVKPRPKAEFSPMESGTFVHYLLEKVLEECGEAFKSTADEALAALAQKYTDIFVAENDLPVHTKREQFRLGQILETTTRLLCYLRDAAAQSEFTTDALELTIADEEGAVPPLEVQTPGGHTLRVTGQVDRVDVLHRDGKTYLCIVDYKTGSKKFSMEDVFCGLNMQMLMYMDTLCKNAAERYQNPVPAGVLYLTSDPAPTTGSRAGAKAPLYKLDGLLLDDPALLRALDREGEGVFLPFKHRDGKPLRAGKKLAELAKIGNMQRHVETLLSNMAEDVYNGSFTAVPRVKNNARPCSYCPYRAACRHEDGLHELPVQAPENVFEPQQEEDADGSETVD